MSQRYRVLAVCKGRVFCFYHSRYFTNQELRELFDLDDPRVSTTQQQLKDMHQHHSNTDEKFDKHLKYLENLECKLIYLGEKFVFGKIYFCK